MARPGGCEYFWNHVGVGLSVLAFWVGRHNSIPNYYQNLLGK